MNFDMIAARDLNRLINDKSAFIIDLRSPEEYVENHIQGAVNIPYEKLQKCYSLPKDMTLILYCERGSTSMRAAKELAAKGYRVKTVTGGIHSYYSVLK